MDQRLQPKVALGQNCPTSDGYSDALAALKDRYCFYRQKYVVMAPA